MPDLSANVTSAPSTFVPGKGQPVALVQKVAEQQLSELAAQATYYKGLDQVWESSVLDSYTSSPRAYRHTHALLKAFSGSDFLASIRVRVSNDLSFNWSADYFLDTKAVLEEHVRKQRTGTVGQDKAMQKIKFGGEYPPSVGIVGSLQILDKSYLLPYLACGPNAPGQPIVYRALGNRFKNALTQTRHAAPRHQLVTIFLRKIGFVPPASTPSASGWHIALSEVIPNSVIDTLFNTVIQKTMATVFTGYPARDNPSDFEDKVSSASS